MFNIENLYLLPFLSAPVKILIIYFIMKLLNTKIIAYTLSTTVLINIFLTIGLLFAFGVKTVDTLLVEALISDTLQVTILYFIVYYALINTTTKGVIRNILKVIIALILITSSYILIKSYTNMEATTVTVKINPVLKVNKSSTVLYLKNNSNTNATVSIHLNSKEITLTSKQNITLKANAIKKSFLKLKLNEELSETQQVAIIFTINNKDKIIRYITIQK